jgi:hypothetical protein
MMFSKKIAPLAAVERRAMAIGTTSLSTGPGGRRRRQ